MYRQLDDSAVGSVEDSQVVLFIATCILCICDVAKERRMINVRKDLLPEYIQANTWEQAESKHHSSSQKHHPAIHPSQTQTGNVSKPIPMRWRFCEGVHLVEAARGLLGLQVLVK
jgi:hypothetical protein